MTLKRRGPDERPFKSDSVYVEFVLNYGLNNFYSVSAGLSGLTRFGIDSRPDIDENPASLRLTG